MKKKSLRTIIGIITTIPGPLVQYIETSGVVLHRYSEVVVRTLTQTRGCFNKCFKEW